MDTSKMHMPVYARNEVGGEEAIDESGRGGRRGIGRCCSGGGELCETSERGGLLARPTCLPVRSMAPSCLNWKERRGGETSETVVGASYSLKK